MEQQDTQQDPAPFLIGEASRCAQVSERTMRGLVDTGIIPAIRTSSGVRLIDRAAVEAFARAREAKRSGRTS